jgi:hypothetical protein
MAPDGSCGGIAPSGDERAVQGLLDSVDGGVDTGSRGGGDRPEGDWSFLERDAA